MRKVKRSLMLLSLIIFKYHMRAFYFFIKIFTKRKKRVFFLSRQFNEMSLNYNMIAEKLKEDGIEYVSICKRVPSSVNTLVRNEKKKRKFFDQMGNILKYYFNIYKQMYYAATSKVIVIDGYNLVTSVLNHKKDTVIVQMWHALAAIKKFGYQTVGYKGGLDPRVAKILCMHKNYDYVISGSKEMSKYFKEAFNTDAKIIPCGTPTVDFLLKNDKNIADAVYEKYPELKDKAKKNILYAPTFRNNGSNNAKAIIEEFDFDKYNLILALHPKDIGDIKDERCIIIDGKLFSAEDMISVSDYVITDYSSLAITSCILNKRVLLYVYDYEEYIKVNGLNIDLFEELKGNVSKDLNEILNIIDEDKYDMKSYEKFKEKYINNLNGTSTECIVSIIEENL